MAPVDFRPSSPGSTAYNAIESILAKDLRSAVKLARRALVELEKTRDEGQVYTIPRVTLIDSRHHIGRIILDTKTGYQTSESTVKTLECTGVWNPEAEDPSTSALVFPLHETLAPFLEEARRMAELDAERFEKNGAKLQEREIIVGSLALATLPKSPLSLEQVRTDKNAAKFAKRLRLQLEYDSYDELSSASLIRGIVGNLESLLSMPYRSKTLFGCIEHRRHSRAEDEARALVEKYSEARSSAE